MHSNAESGFIWQGLRGLGFATESPLWRTKVKLVLQLGSDPLTSTLCKHCNRVQSPLRSSDNDRTRLMLDAGLDAMDLCRPSCYCSIIPGPNGPDAAAANSSLKEVVEPRPWAF